MVPKVCGVVPCGNQVFVEMLTDEETLGTTIKVMSSTGKAKREEAYQAYVLAVGPAIGTDCGFKVGDRVMFSTSAFTPAPKYDNGERQRGTLDPSAIKAVLLEAE